MDKPLPPPPSPVLRPLLIVATVLTVVFTGWSAYVAYDLTTPPRRPVGPVPPDFPFPVESVRFPAQDGVPLAGWYLPCPEATHAVVLLHGSRRNRLTMVPHARLLRAHGYAVLLYDARGHGESGDAPCSFGWHETKDLLGAMDYLRGRGFKEFGLLGLSQGGITIALAADRLRNLAWVVLECTPADARDVFDHDTRRSFGVPGWLANVLVFPFIEWRLGVRLRDYAPRDAVTNLHCPIFIIAGGADARVFPEEARQVFEQANEPKAFWLIPGAPHTNFSLYPTKGEYEKRLLAFIDDAVK
jgi:pimeloyl-ACP methyl ester carboxylesterase